MVLREDGHAMDKTHVFAVFEHTPEDIFWNARYGRIVVVYNVWSIIDTMQI